MRLPRRHPASSVVAQSTYPVELEAAKFFVGADDSANDLVERLVRAATKYFQKRTGHWTTQATLLQVYDGFYPPCDRDTDASPIERLELEFGPVQSVTWVKYYDEDGTLTTLSSSTEYWVSLQARPPAIVPQYGLGWPAVQMGRPESVRVQYVAGYATVEAMDEGILQAILQLVKHWFANPDPVLTTGGVPQNIPHSLGALIDTYKLWGYR